MILQALDQYYKRMAERGEAPPVGFVSQVVKCEVVLSKDGDVIEVGRLGESGRGIRSFVPEPITEPSARTATAVVPYFLVDNPSYILGVKPGDNRVQRKFEASAALHALILQGTQSEALLALLKFFERHREERERAWPLDVVDGNYVFRVDGRGPFEWLHDLPEARARWLAYLEGMSSGVGQCLVSGDEDRIVRLHPKLTGFRDADTLVGFNAPAFSSYGRDQGENAPTTRAAAHRYGAAANAMLSFDSPNRLKRGIGEATVVFWADTSELINEPAARAAENFFASVFEPASEDDDQDDVAAAKVQDALRAVAEGRPEIVNVDLKPGARFHVLGLSPNAARLSVRFWQSDTLEVFAAALARHVEDIAIAPTPWRGRPPAIWRLLLKTTALQEKFENLPPLLAGELTRAVLTGAPYPRTWLTAAITRLRAGDSPASGWHAAAIKACINRRLNEEDLPVALDRNHDNVAYQLGRLFAVIEAAQYAALGRVNASVADRYYASASSTPARVFASLLRGARTHVSDAKRRGTGVWIEKKLDEIVDRLPPDLPRTLRLEDQGRFAVGYYHERASRPAKPDAPVNEDADAEPAAATA